MIISIITRQSVFSERIKLYDRNEFIQPNNNNIKLTMDVVLKERNEKDAKKKEGEFSVIKNNEMMTHGKKNVRGLVFI